MEKVEFTVYVLYDAEEGRYFWTGSKDEGVVDLESATIYYSKIKAMRARDVQNARGWNLEVIPVSCTLEEKADE